MYLYMLFLPVKIEKTLVKLVDERGPKAWKEITDEIKINYPNFDKTPKQCRER